MDMSLGKRFRFHKIPPEDRAQWMQLLRGELMEPLYFSPRFPTDTRWLWLLSLAGVVGAVWLFTRRLGDMWVPAGNWWSSLGFAFFAIVAVYGLLLAVRRRTLATMHVPAPGRYLFPIGYLDTSEAVWTFIGFEDVEKAVLEDFRRPVSRLPASMCTLILRDASKLHFPMPTMLEAEELTDVMLMLLESEESPIEGLDEVRAEFGTLADVAAAAQKNPTAGPEDALWRDITLILRLPLLVALVVGGLLGTGLYQVRDRLHVHKQIAKAVAKKDIEALRMISHWTHYAAQGDMLKHVLREFHQAALKQVRAKSHKQAKTLAWFGALFPVLQKRLDPVVSLRIQYRAAVAPDATTRRAIDALYRGPTGERISWSLAAHIRQGLLSLFDESLLRLERGKATSSFHYYFLVGQDKESRVAYRYRQRIQQVVKGLVPTPKKGSEIAQPTLLVTWQPWTTGAEYQIVKRGKKGAVVAARQVEKYPALSFRIVFTFTNPALKRRPLRFAFQVAPARWLGFAKEAKGAKAKALLLSGIPSEGAPRIYASMAAAAWQKVKQLLPTAILGQDTPHYEVPAQRPRPRVNVRKRVVAPASRPAPGTPPRLRVPPPQRPLSSRLPVPSRVRPRATTRPGHPGPSVRKRLPSSPQERRP